MPIRDRRWVLEHISVLSDDDIARIRDLGLVVTTHTNSYIAKQGAILSTHGSGLSAGATGLAARLLGGVDFFD